MTHKPNPLRRAAESVFVPVADAGYRTSRPKALEGRPRLPLKWPKDGKGRKEMFDAWHAVAMQVCHEADVSFRMMATVERFIHWNTGTFWATNETIALRAGGCSERTIKRDISSMCTLGLFISELGWRRTAGGKLVRTRLIRLSVPTDLEPSTWLPSGIHGDNSCPHELLGIANDHGDNGCPNHGDTCCPITLEETHEKGGTDAA